MWPSANATSKREKKILGGKLVRNRSNKHTLSFVLFFSSEEECLRDERERRIKHTESDGESERTEIKAEKISPSQDFKKHYLRYSTLIHLPL